MLAARLMSPGCLVIGECASPECPEKGVLVRVKSCGLCAADARMVQTGHPALSYPRIPGHELTGTIEESRVENIQPGLRVQVPPGLSCGVCRYCLRGDDHQCLQREVFGFSRDGGFAELIPVPLHGPLRAEVLELPQEVDFRLGIMAEPVACCLNAQSKLDLRSSDRVLIMGGGIMGVLHALAAQAKGVTDLAVCEPLPERRRIAAGCGVDKVLDPAKDELRQGVMDWTEGMGVDVIVLASSDVTLGLEILGLLARGGRLSVFSGGMPAGNGVGTLLSTVHYQEFQITGAYGCRRRDNRAALECIAERPALFSGLIDNVTGLVEVEQGLRQTRNRTSLKAVMEVERG